VRLAERDVAYWHEADIQVGAPHVRYQGKPDVTQTYLDGRF